MISDWESFVQSHSDEISEELDLDCVRPGDTLHVVTDHTDYVFEIVQGSEAELHCSRPDRPTGRVRIAGCGFGFSTTFKPRRLFSGGHLDITLFRDAGALNGVVSLAMANCIISEAEDKS